VAHEKIKKVDLVVRACGSAVVMLVGPLPGEQDDG
jgi:hypothetical protein